MAQTQDWKLELIAVPVSDIDRAKDFYVSIGFNADHDQTVSDEIRFVQLTPPGSACSIVLDLNFSGMAPGVVKGLQCVVKDADAAREFLVSVGVEASPVDEQAWGRFVFFSDPDGNGWALQQLPEWSPGYQG
jgi:catechol 2,3-dioxygenase-like lactoylglutathione lyase family enzyme